MKTIKQFGFALAIIFSLTLSSCGGSDDGGGGGSAANGTIKAKVGGTNFTSMTQASFAYKQAIGNAYMITLQGSTASGKAIQLILNGVDGQPGTYEISDTANISAVGTYTEINVNTLTSQTWAAPYDGSGAAGSITISEITDTNIKGTFSFTAKNQEGSDTKAVTNGAFNLDFQSN